ncbi:MAG: hypothetical protein HY917_00190 [Candidatus Diapherotrites archaeon]|nr:hypothetical protein [Candidatus Diapherotrites archaeon]
MQTKGGVYQAFHTYKTRGLTRAQIQEAEARRLMIMGYDSKEAQHMARENISMYM